jgi:hypothetical protein
MKTLAILLIAGALVSPAFAEPRSAMSHSMTSPHMATYSQSHKSTAISRNDADKDFDNDLLRPDGGQR